MITLTEVADWVSIIALLISIFNTLLIFSVKRRIMLNVTLEPLLQRLRDNSQIINDYLLSQTEITIGLNEVVWRCEAEAKAIQRRFGFYRARFCRRLLQSIAHYRRHGGVSAARVVYDNLQQVIQDLANRIEELRIMGS